MQILLIAASVLVSGTGCAQDAQMAVAQNTVLYPAPRQVPEVYINISDEQVKDQARERNYTDLPAESLLISGSNPQSTPSKVAEGEQVMLEPFEVNSKTLYRINGEDYLIRRPLEENSNAKTAVANCAKRLNTLQASHPDVRVYTYFITRATDCNWFSSYNNIQVFDYASYFEQQLGADTQITSSRYVIQNLQDYKDTGYKTDFHVNNVGSYRVYRDIYTMLSADMQLSPLQSPLRENDFSKLPMIGDLFDEEMLKSVTLSNAEMDVFKVYEFDYGSYTTFVNDKKMTIGLEEEYAKGMIDRSPTFGHQFSYYGGQTGIVRFEFEQPDKPNLLLLSDSQGRPSRKLLASHFNRTIFLDDVQWRSEDIDKIIQDNDIGVVILMGQESMFELYNG